MNSGLIPNIVSIGIGVVGIAIAFHQSYKVKRVSQVVRDWGADISERLVAAHDSMERLRDEIDRLDAIQWPHSKGQVKHVVQEQTNMMAQLVGTMKLFVSNATGDKSHNGQ